MKQYQKVNLILVIYKVGSWLMDGFDFNFIFLPIFNFQILLVYGYKLATMRRRGDRSLTKIYKDLMITKRQLSDLRQSITKTLYGLKNPQVIHPASIKSNKKVCYLCGVYSDPAVPHKCHSISIRCPNCCQFFTTSQKLKLHQDQTHYFCNKCRRNFDETPEDHEGHFCSQTRLSCQRCGATIKRKQLQAHVCSCLFLTCSKCKKSVYYKVYHFHVEQCSSNRSAVANLPTKRRKFTKREQVPLAPKHHPVSIVPCCIMN